ncbi:hypothetical protein SK128_025846, partial [Halocaridina rubra]
TQYKPLLSPSTHRDFSWRDGFYNPRHSPRFTSYGKDRSYHGTYYNQRYPFNGRYRHQDPWANPRTHYDDEFPAESHCRNKSCTNPRTNYNYDYGYHPDETCGLASSAQIKGVTAESDIIVICCFLSSTRNGQSSIISNYGMKKGQSNTYFRDPSTGFGIYLYKYQMLSNIKDVPEVFDIEFSHFGQTENNNTVSRLHIKSLVPFLHHKASMSQNSCVPFFMPAQYNTKLM